MNVASYAFFRDPRPESKRPRKKTDSWRTQYYARYLPALVRTHHAIFPDWELRIHHDSSIWSCYYGDVILNLADLGLLKLIQLPDPKEVCEGMLWRMRPIWDHDVDAVITRDVDSMPSPRERVMVDEWLASDKAVHVIHDSTSHYGMMGGLCGYRAAQLRGLTEMHSFAGLTAAPGQGLQKYGGDQTLLNERIVPHVGGHIFAHTHRKNLWPDPERAWKDGEVIKPVPPLAAGDEFVGDVANHYVPVREYTAPGIELIERSLSVPVGQSEPVTPAKRVILSATPDPSYSFFVPFAVELWRRIDFKPTLFLVGTEADWMVEPYRLVLNRARRNGAEIHFTPRLEGYRDSTIAQVVRLCAGGIDEDEFKDHQYAITADIDIWPLKGSWFQSDAPLTSWYWNAHGTGPRPHRPMCFLQATGAIWRALVPTPTPAGILTTLAKETDWDTAWNFDEAFISNQIADFEAAGGPVKNIDRFGAPPKDRIDRSNWPRGRAWEAMVERDAVDAHLLRPAHTEDNWPEIRGLFKKIAPGCETWLDQYHADFVAGLAATGQ